MSTMEPEEMSAGSRIEGNSIYKENVSGCALAMND
jgi:hypothetical protein